MEVKANSIKSALLYFTAFLSGAVSLILEIIGTRVLSPFYGSTIFVLSSVIAVALGFLAIGYFAGGAIADRRKNPADLFIILGFTGAGILAGFKFAVPILLWSDRFGMIYGPLVAVSIIYFLRSEEHTSELQSQFHL